ncbi:MAG: extracellular solute-binding protein [Lachnospiraceae bacterium]|nr:extracellular solute-binding protein [Lachnospiraceae bacterium]
MKKKAVSIFLTTALLVSSLVGCGSDTQDAGNAPAAQEESGGQDTAEAAAEPVAETAENSPIKITFWNSFTGADGDMLTELVDRYNKENTDGITVEMDISSDFDSQLSTAFAAGTGPTMILSSSAYRFTYGDYMQNINDIFDKTGLDKNDFIQSYLDYCSEGDNLYFVPFQIVGYYMYWNKDLFEAAGLDPEAPPATWDEWAEYAEKLTDESKNVYGSGISYDYAYQIAHIMQRFGGLAVTDNGGNWTANFAGNSGYTKFLNMYQEMVNNGSNPLEADTDSMASAGQIGMTIGGPWVTIGLDTAGINYGIGLIPTGDAGDMNSVEVLGFSVTTAASDAEKEAAYKFIEWWNSENAEGSSPALEWSVANGFPAYTYSVQEKDEYKASAKLSAMSTANPDAPTDFIVDSSFPGINAVIADVIPELINSVAFGGSPVEEALEKAQATAEKITENY